MSDIKYAFYQTSSGYKVTGKSDNDILLAGGGSIAKSNFVSNSDAVHKTGDETINDFKVFNKPVIAQKGIAKIVGSEFGIINIRTDAVSFSPWGGINGVIVIELPSLFNRHEHFEISVCTDMYAQLRQKIFLQTYSGYFPYSNVMLDNQTQNPDFLTRCRLGTKANGKSCIILNETSTQSTHIQVLVDKYSGSEAINAKEDWYIYSTTDISDITIQADMPILKPKSLNELINKENVFSKNTAFNKNFGTATDTVAQGNDSRIVKGLLAFNSLDNYIPNTGGTVTGTINLIVPGQPLIVRGTEQTGNYMTWKNYSNASHIAYIGADGGAAGGGGTGDNFVIRGINTLKLYSTNPLTVNDHVVWHAGNFTPSDFATEYWVNTNFIPKSHAVYNVTSSMVISWNAAYSWGDHSQQGYVRESQLNTEIQIDHSEVRLVPSEHHVDSTSSTIVDDINRLITIIGDYNVAQYVDIRSIYSRQKYTFINLSKDYVMSINFPGLNIYFIDPSTKVTFYITDNGEVILMDKSSAEIWT